MSEPYLTDYTSAALNWPDHRGTATAFPLSCFGLSAFFFSLLGGIAFPDNTSGYLLLLSIGPFAFIFLSFFFLHTPNSSVSYSALATGEDDQTVEDSRPNHIRRSKSQESRLTLEQGKTSQGICSLYFMLFTATTIYKLCRQSLLHYLIPLKLDFNVLISLTQHQMLPVLPLSQDSISGNYGQCWVYKLGLV
jgi:hypothetical protein